jgi:pSer/pThr/pTyr-binding forkhead associated (FHA) protein
MNEMPARLIVKLGPNPKKEYTLSQPEITIGRSPGNAIVVPNPEVSRRHARIRRDGSNYLIEDWGSTNGTFVSGQRIMGHTILRHGDEIRLGEYITYIFVNEPEKVSFLAAERVPGPDPELTIVDANPLQSQPQESKPAPQQAPPVNLQKATKDEFILPEELDKTGRNRLRLFGCGCLVILIPLLCMATLIFLDFYEQGRFLYCGPMRPIFEIFLGPIGFAPVCP